MSNHRKDGLAARVVDRVLEAPVVPSFTRLGPAVRRRVAGWTKLDGYHLDGRVVVVTGATSGLGLAAARQLAACRATVVLWGRDAGRLDRTRDEIGAAVPGAALETVAADMGDLDAIRRGAAELLSRHVRIDVLVHNAGALTADRRSSPQGIEQTVASQVVGPFLLTSLLMPALRAASPGRVVTVSSGGMYAAPLTVTRLQMGADYKGAEQYARAKRAQVTLNEMWAARVPAGDVVFHAMHPGWADTPGVAASLPTFRRVVGPLLRTPAEGADTIVWLAADDDRPARSSGLFWLDRAERPIHRIPSTRRSDTPERRAALWEWVAAAAGVDERAEDGGIGGTANGAAPAGE
ncbi:MAG: SDR family NAD(P)-dependent oxidoreductase [Ilumatobacteraceae bacterium]